MGTPALALVRPYRSLKNWVKVGKIRNSNFEMPILHLPSPIYEGSSYLLTPICYLLTKKA